MKFEEIVVLNREPIAQEGYVGGGCNLDSSIDWPNDAGMQPCMHLLTVPCKFFDKNYSERFISVFIPYADRKFYKQIRGEENHTSIIIHDDSGTYRNEYFNDEVTTIPRALSVEIRSEEDSQELCTSKIFNVPGWLQGEIVFSNHRCVFSMYGNDFSSAFTEPWGLFFDGVAYVFVKENYKNEKNGSDVGKLFLQLG